MLSFRTEIENPIVQKDILELEKKIHLYHNGKMDEDGFRSLRLARGIYGQRQEGVQMIRIKLPFGKLTSKQLHRIANVSDKYSTGRLHITTRQDIQIHYVSLDKTPELWAELEKDDITLREACGNAVRNITASESSGIDPEEAFDVSPYADVVFRFFLRNPICQELGRKFKISFSNSQKDTGLSFMHDIGFIAKLREKDGQLEKGFQVMVGGGLGSAPRQADLVHEFLPADQIIPFTEGVLRVFDRFGERNRRAKARLKHLILKIGLEEFLKLVDEEQKALSRHSLPIAENGFEKTYSGLHRAPSELASNLEQFQAWQKGNVFEQKQAPYYAIGIKVRLGDFFTDKARQLADLVHDYAGDELRLTVNQGILIRDVHRDDLPFFFNRLAELGFTELGYDKTADITACPGTDTCNLGIAGSTGLANELERTLWKDHPNFAINNEVNIKISGCMNACGQHSIAQIGFHGMSMKAKGMTLPAFQVLLGGGVLGNGQGRFADKIIKIPSKRAPKALGLLVEDFEQRSTKEESFLDYYLRQEKNYFYHLLKPLADLEELEADIAIDWGNNEAYVKAIGVGECAGVVIDLVTTLLFESKEKIDNAQGSIEEGRWADSIYHSYAALLNTAKAVLIGEGLKTNTQSGIIADFDKYFVHSGLLELDSDFASLIYKIKHNSPSEAFAQAYLAEARTFLALIENLKNQNAE